MSVAHRDVVLDNERGQLYIAMAGTHQIWAYSLERGGKAFALAGNGAERNLNGSRLSSVSFAQPSGLSLVENTLVIADSESSSIRAIDLDQVCFHTRPLSCVPTLVGGWVVVKKKKKTAACMSFLQNKAFGIAGGDPIFADNLFRFGDHDGTGSSALLQHPLAALTLSSDTALIADSYNHKIKRVNLKTGLNMY